MTNTPNTAFVILVQVGYSFRGRRLTLESNLVRTLLSEEDLRSIAADTMMKSTSNKSQISKF